MVPPKSRKSLSFWQKCEECSCIVSVKDLTNHLNYCASPREDWPFGYIVEQTLYGNIEDVRSKEIPEIFNLKKSIVLLSQSAMQICRFCIGFPVLVEVGNFATVLNAWPTAEGTLTTVGVDKNELEELSGSPLESASVKVSSLIGKLLVAEEIHYRLLSPRETLPDLEQFNRSLQSSWKGKAVFVGMLLKQAFYGKKTRLQLSHITSCDLDLSSGVENLSISDDRSFYLVDEKTTWVEEKKPSPEEELKPPSRNLRVGGYSSIILNLEKNIAFTFQPRQEGSSSFSALLYGPSGTGKSLIAEYVSQRSGKPLIRVEGSDLFSKFYGETESRLRGCFEEARLKAPCILMLDNIETLASRKGTDQEMRVLSCLLTSFDSIRSYPIVVLATTVEPDLLDPSLRRPGRLETEIELNIPNEADRAEILKVLLSSDVLDWPEETYRELAESCHGFSGADLAGLVRTARAEGVPLSEAALRSVLCRLRPSAMRHLEVRVPSVEWSEIGGGREIRLRLEQAVEWPLRYGDRLKRLGIQAPRGVLLYGPPGCSKTLLVKALATQTKLNFISIKGSDVFSKWVGESEKAIRDLFRSARKVAPAIVFIDEADALGASRGSSGPGSSGVQDRVLSQLLTEMDGVTSLEGVVVIAATNRPDCIDKALLRPGRLDRIIYVPLPDHETRRQIFEIQLKKIPTSDVDIEELADRTEGYSGAEIVGVCREAALNALTENLDTSHVSREHFLAALSTLTPRTPASLLSLYADYQSKGNNLL